MNIRPRRLRSTQAIRNLVTETRFHPQSLVQPLFLVDGTNIKSELKTLPGTFRLSLDKAFELIQEGLVLGIRTFILFPALEEHLKDSEASISYSQENFYLKHIREIKARFPEICLISDVALDPYNSDGHDGLVRDGKILNDETLPILAKMAVAQAEAGIDIIGPSDMMDGRVGVIRKALDNAGFADVGIMSYSAKYASSFYGPFREALDSAPKSGDKKTYQMDPANRREAGREALLDEQEGADFLMVKPALHYLDIISDLKRSSNLPIAAYHVSGECALLAAAAKEGWLDLEKAVPETINSIARAGADVIITYFAFKYAEWFWRNR